MKRFINHYQVRQAINNNHTQPSKHSELVLNVLKQATTNEIEKNAV